ncbi:MAG: helix-turn-helix transcriptional regulator [Muribaculaceae bacterium]|nr:helix-turn-helix transcriptional regulator [Muribaculaceae bacterium]
MKETGVQQQTPLQQFFTTHKEIKVSEFAKMIGIDATLLRNYINGFKKPSKEREQMILDGIHALANQYATAVF